MQRKIINAVSAAATGALVVLGSGIAFADDGSGPGLMRDGGRRHHPWFMLMCFVVVLAIGAMVWWLIARSRRHTDAGAPVRHAETILAERLARGEITAEEYRSLLATLKNEKV